MLIHSHRILFPWQLLLQGGDIVYEHEPQLSLNHYAPLSHGPSHLKMIGPPGFIIRFRRIKTIRKEWF